ncbi:glutaminyl-peptide cyclotransferase [Phlyctema vagabunda]|uniref:Peptide hydrolase n=1 Tax=Phlyctema vagabunda TaxID=108571 RepID=A0ABR4PVY7_9HELO
MLSLYTLFTCAILAFNIQAYTPLTDDTLRNIPGGAADFDIKTGALLAPILIPRVPGTPGSAKVLQHFVDFFTKELPNWTIEYQNSTSKTPGTGDKDVPFVNLIITRDPPWTQPGNVGRLALVAHYDSLMNPAGFIGATDSAVPCALIMHAARSVDEALTRKWEAMKAEGLGDRELEEEVGVQILLLDGEEAFVSWTDTDSLYGARSLAETWEATAHPATSTFRSALNSISLFFLLDLIGAASPNIPSYFKTTHWAYQKLASIESRLRSLSVLQSEADHAFLPDTNKAADSFHSAWTVQDDHIPFMARGVEVLHIIPTPFPRVWHHMTDDGEHLDMPTVEDWAKIVTAFVAEWMDLEGHFAPAARMHKERSLLEKSEL